MRPTDVPDQGKPILMSQKTRHRCILELGSLQGRVAVNISAWIPVTYIGM